MDTDKLGRLLLKVEAETHTRGWDGHPRLLILEDQAEAGDREQPPFTLPRVRCEGYNASDIVPPQALEPNAAHNLFRLATNMAEEPDHPFVRAALKALRRPGFLGIAVVFEAWGVQATLEERQAMAKLLADEPGAVESREVWAATVEGDIWNVNRTRGKQPTLHRPEPGHHAEGAVPESLRRLVAVIADQQVPAAAHYPSRWSR